jgi:uncharacterized membrane protein YsdA (DUF1294 family)
MKRRPRRANAEQRYGIGFGSLALLLFALLLWSRVVTQPLVCWLLAISLTAFIAYGVDKLCALTHWLRVPEWVLIGLALAGGTTGALLAMLAFHHKTSKRGFQWRFWLVVAFQALLVGAYFALLMYS